MNLVILEDEAVAARQLERMLGEIDPRARVLAVLPTVEAAVAWFSSHAMPDLVFMDIHLADGLSFEVAEAVEITAPVIFTTAYEHYALRAFELNSIDYLLKPIGPERLAESLARLHKRRGPDSETWRRLLRTMNRFGEPEPPRKYKQRFLVKLGTRLFSIEAERIAYFYRQELVHLRTLGGRTFPISQSLDELESLLDPTRFFRLNRQYLAHIQSIHGVAGDGRARLKLSLGPNAAVTAYVSEEKAAAFKRWLDGERDS